MIIPDVWLSEVMERPAYTLVAPDVEQMRSIGKPGALITMKVPTTRVGFMRECLAAGFYVVDTQIRLQRQPGGFHAKRQKPQAGDLSLWRIVRVMTPHDWSGMLDIAESSFCSRFHLDPAIAPEMAARIKRAWMGAYASGDRGRAYVAHDEEGAVTGFIGLMPRDGSIVIDLIAVGEQWRGRGVGKDLIRAAVREATWQPCEVSTQEGDTPGSVEVFPAATGQPCEVSTQVSNIASLALYQSEGFRIIESRYVLHRHEAAR